MAGDLTGAAVGNKLSQFFEPLARPAEAQGLAKTKPQFFCRHFHVSGLKIHPRSLSFFRAALIKKPTHQVIHVRLLPSHLLEIHLLLLEPPLEFSTVSHANQIDLCGIKQAL